MAPLILWHIQDLKPATILDVGPGHGKYGVLCKEYLHPTPTVDACEAWEPYIQDFNLKGIYPTIYPTDVMLLPTDTLNTYDTILLLDIIEHLDKDDALTLLARITVPVVICTPVDFFHNGDNLPWTETHRSHWTEQDFRDTGKVTRYDNHLGGHVTTLQTQ